MNNLKWSGRLWSRYIIYLQVYKKMNLPCGRWLFAVTLICAQWTHTLCQNQLTPEEINQIFLELFVEEYGKNNVIQEDQLQNFFPKVGQFAR